MEYIAPLNEVLYGSASEKLKAKEKWSDFVTRHDCFHQKCEQSKVKPLAAYAPDRVGFDTKNAAEILSTVRNQLAAQNSAAMDYAETCKFFGGAVPQAITLVAPAASQPTVAQKDPAAAGVKVGQ